MQQAMTGGTLGVQAGGIGLGTGMTCHLFRK